jgi:uncharacterized phage-associated protein
VTPGIFTGYVTPDPTKVIELVLFFAEKMNVLKTKLNKLLFYTDFLHYQQYGYGITGLSYRAIQWGPVPASYESIFEYAAARKYIEIRYLEFEDGKCGEQFVPCQEHTFDHSLFSHIELETAQYVMEKFTPISTKDIIALSHEEKGWVENIEQKGKISYNYAFELKHI